MKSATAASASPRVTARSNPTADPTPPPVASTSAITWRVSASGSNRIGRGIAARFGRRRRLSRSKFHRPVVGSSPSAIRRRNRRRIAW